MACFTLAWAEQLCIWIIIISAVVAIIRVVIPWLTGLMGGIPGPVVQIMNIILWAVIAIMVVYIFFALISCIAGGPGLTLLPHR